MMKSFEEDATKALLELTAKSVISPFTHIKKKDILQTRNGKDWGNGSKETQSRLTSCPRQLAKQNAVSMDHIFTRRSSEPVITYRPERSNVATENRNHK